MLVENTVKVTLKKPEQKVDKQKFTLYSSPSNETCANSSSNNGNCTC